MCVRQGFSQHCSENIVIDSAVQWGWSLQQKNACRCFVGLLPNSPMEAWNRFTHLLNLDRTCDLFWSTECIRNDGVLVQSLASRDIVHFLVLGISPPQWDQVQHSRARCTLKGYVEQRLSFWAKCALVQSASNYLQTRGLGDDIIGSKGAAWRSQVYGTSS